MINISDIVRPNILALKPYSSARDEFKGNEGIFLDANENPYGRLNRYPDPQQRELKSKLAQLKGVKPEQIFVGNGSDEVIELAFRIFCTPGKDKALTFSPTYGMYKVSAAINDVELINIPLTEEFQIDREAFKPYLEDKHIKLIFLCSPNNPTGNILRKEDIEYVLTNFRGIVIVDEAYIDFADTPSTIELLDKYNNLIVSQTFSKAWGLAGIRVGTAYAHKEILALYNKVKPPYNISRINQEEAVRALDNMEEYQKHLDLILSERSRLLEELKNISAIKKIYPTDANFILVEVDDADKLYDDLVSKGIIIRNRNTAVKNCLRFSIGTKEENDRLLEGLREV